MPIARQPADHQDVTAIIRLLSKHRVGNLTTDERAALEAWQQASPANALLMVELQDESKQREALALLHTFATNGHPERIIATDRKQTYRKSVLRWLRPVGRRWPYAAAAVLVAALVGYFAVVSRQSMVDSPGISDIAPGGNRATLTLADGRTIDLSEAQTGIVIGDGITYLDGSAVLDEQVNEGASENGHNSPHGGLTTSDLQLTTPKGGTYQITLPDGTKVWLNAASTLKYPSRFDGIERVVELSGEAYFDVSGQVSKGASEQVNGGLDAKGSSSQIHKFTRSQVHKLTGSQKIPKLARELRAAPLVPFKVITNGQTVEVLGTEFNISAYADDPETTTTLVEGKVKISAASRQAGLTTNDLRLTTNDTRLTTNDLRLTTNDLRLTTKVLTPGDQAITRGAHTQIHQVDVTQYTAWKDGYFKFQRQPITEIMKQLARWYDVDVQYEGPIQDILYSGRIARQENISAVLHIMEMTDAIQFEIQENERRIIVKH